MTLFSGMPFVCVCSGPGRKQEELRRKIENGVRELWYFVRSEVKKLGHVETGELQKHINMLLQDLGHHQRCFYQTCAQNTCIQFTIIIQLIFLKEMFFFI